MELASNSLNLPLVIKPLGLLNKARAAWPGEHGAQVIIVLLDLVNIGINKINAVRGTITQMILQVCSGCNQQIRPKFLQWP